MKSQLKMDTRNVRLKLIILIFSTFLFEKSSGSNACNFPAIFNFGDSNSDTGSNHAVWGGFAPPYCETWRPKGGCLRQSDGRLIIDFIAEKLGLPYLPGCKTPWANYTRQGVNFAGGGETIDAVVNKQKGIFMQVIDVARRKPSSDRLRLDDISKALYIIDIGQNDVNYDWKTKTPQEAAGEMSKRINKLGNFIKEIYEIGGRIFWIHNTGPLGCLVIVGEKDEIGCAKAVNDVCQEFNKQLKDMVYRLRDQLKDASLVYVDVYTAKYSLFKDAEKLGFKEPLEFCCRPKYPLIPGDCGLVGAGEISLSEVLSECTNPKGYIKFDGGHYTEIANQMVANHIMNGSLCDPPVPITEACTKLNSPKIEL